MLSDKEGTVEYTKRIRNRDKELELYENDGWVELIGQTGHNIKASQAHKVEICDTSFHGHSTRSIANTSTKANLQIHDTKKKHWS